MNRDQWFGNHKANAILDLGRTPCVCSEPSEPKNHISAFAPPHDGAIRDFGSDGSDGSENASAAAHKSVALIGTKNDGMRRKQNKRVAEDISAAGDKLGYTERGRILASAEDCGSYEDATTDEISVGAEFGGKMNETLVICDRASPIEGRPHWLEVFLKCPGCGRRHSHGWDRRSGPGTAKRCPPCAAADPRPGRPRLDEYLIAVGAELLASARKRKRPAKRRYGPRRPKSGPATPTPQIGSKEVSNG